LLAVFQLDELGFAPIRRAWIKRARERGVGVHAVHAIEDQDVLAWADMIELKNSF